MTVSALSPGQNEAVEELDEILVEEKLRGPNARAAGGVSWAPSPTHPRGASTTLKGGAKGPLRAGASIWARLIPRPIWDFLSHVEFVETDAAVPARERLFR